MKKTFILVLLSLVCAVCCAFGLAACGDKDNGGNSGPNQPTSDHVHDWSDWVITTPATCSAPGRATRTCKTNPNHKDYTDVAIEPEAHLWDDGETVIPATCMEKGEKKFVCLHNGEHTKTEDIPIDNNAHDWDSWKVTKESCTGKGEETRVCKRDEKHTQTRETEPMGHYLASPTSTECGRCKTPLAQSFTITRMDASSYQITKGTALDTKILIIPAYVKTGETMIPITQIADRAFMSNIITEIQFSPTLSKIGASAFSGCSGLQSVNIPDNVYSIGSAAFERCIVLKTVTIGRGTSQIGSGAFRGCTSLQTVTFTDTTGWKFVDIDPITNTDLATNDPQNITDPSSNAWELTKSEHINWSMVKRNY